MAKSKIIKDLANSSVDTLTALKRVKVLLSEFQNDDLKNWIDYEITGYPDGANLPDYRVVQGNLIGSYLKGSMATHMKWTNVSLPLGSMPDYIREELLSLRFREGVDALKQLSERPVGDKEHLGKVIPADFFPAISAYNNDPYMMITSAEVIIGQERIRNIFSAIENRLLDTLILLEKEFGNLDELDLDVTSKSPEELQTIADKIIVIIYNDQSVTVGNGNKIKNSTIMSGNEN